MGNENGWHNVMKYDVENPMCKTKIGDDKLSFIIEFPLLEFRRNQSAIPRDKTHDLLILLTFYQINILIFTLYQTKMKLYNIYHILTL